MDEPHVHLVRRSAARVTSEVTVEAAEQAALRLAVSLGVRAERAELLHAGANISFVLWPAGVVARVVGEVGRARRDGGRPDAERDVAIAAWLAARGGPVVAPTLVPPAGPHPVDGLLVSFRERAAVRGSGWDDPAATGRSLRTLHELLEDGAPPMPRLPVWEDARRWIEMAGRLSADDRSLLRAHRASADRAIARLGLPVQVLHGDAHPGNLLLTDRGPRWTDFEETGSWPVEWDLACMLNAGLVLGEERTAREAMVRAYGRSPDDPRLAPFHVARTVMAAAWIALTGEYRGAVAPERLRRRLDWLRANG